MNTQYAKIANYIESHGSITPMQAFSDLHITKLATRISEMRKRGWSVDIGTVRGVNEDGRPVTYAIYSNLRKETIND